MEDTLYVSLFLKEDWVFKCYILGKAITKLSENADGGLEVLQALQCVHGGALVGVQKTKPLKPFFMSGGQTKSLKQEKHSKLIFIFFAFLYNLIFTYF